MKDIPPLTFEKFYKPYKTNLFNFIGTNKSHYANKSISDMDNDFDIVLSYR